MAACCSVRRDRSLLPVAISLAAELMAWLECLIRVTMPLSCSAVALASSRMVANTPWKSPCMRTVRSPCDSAVSRPEICSMLEALASSRPLICWASCRKKPSLPSALMRPDRLPAAAWAMTRATSASTSASGVRSRHSTTWPTLSPSSLRMVDTTWANWASPNCMARRATPCCFRLASRPASISPRCSSTVSGRPTSELPASKSGSCLRSSSWYWDRVCSRARLA
ncbi:hypothetical protein D3C71_1505490 [compost metagenome]